jgi:hypothetical protein
MGQAIPPSLSGGAGALVTGRTLPTIRSVTTALIDPISGWRMAAVSVSACCLTTAMHDHLPLLSRGYYYYYYYYYHVI